LENQFDLLPDDAFWKSLPTWMKLEQYFRVSNYSFRAITKRIWRE